MEYQRPRPSFGDDAPGHNGMSGACDAKSSTQWRHDEREQEPANWHRRPPPGQRREHEAPGARHDEAVRPRIRLEDERRERRRARHDAHVLDAGEHEDRPDQIERRDARHLPAEVDRRLAPLGGHRDGHVSDEHARLLMRNSIAAATIRTAAAYSASRSDDQADAVTPRRQEALEIRPRYNHARGVDVRVERSGDRRRAGPGRSARAPNRQRR